MVTVACCLCGIAALRLVWGGFGCFWCLRADYCVLVIAWICVVRLVVLRVDWFCVGVVVCACGRAFGCCFSVCCWLLLFGVVCVI